MIQNKQKSMLGARRKGFHQSQLQVQQSIPKRSNRRDAFDSSMANANANPFNNEFPADLFSLQDLHLALGTVLEEKKEDHIDHIEYIEPVADTNGLVDLSREQSAELLSFIVNTAHYAQPFTRVFSLSIYASKWLSSMTADMWSIFFPNLRALLIRELKMDRKTDCVVHPGVERLSFIDLKMETADIPVWTPSVKHLTMVGSNRIGVAFDLFHRAPVDQLISLTLHMGINGDMYLHNCAELKYLHIDNVWGQLPTGLLELEASTIGCDQDLPQLRYLKIGEFKTKSIDVSTKTVEKFKIQNMNALHTLNVLNDSDLSLNTDIGLPMKNACSYFPQVRNLTIRIPLHYNDDDFIKWISVCPNLESLCVINDRIRSVCDLLSKDTISMLSRRKIKRLELFDKSVLYSPQKDVKDINELLMKLPNLEYLSLFGKFFGMDRILNTLPLKTLNLELPTAQYGWSVPDFSGVQNVNMTLFLSSHCSQLNFPPAKYDTVKIFANDVLQSYPINIILQNESEIHQIETNLITEPLVWRQKMLDLIPVPTVMDFKTEASPFAYCLPSHTDISRRELWSRLEKDTDSRMLKFENTGIQLIDPNMKQKVKPNVRWPNALNVQQFHINDRNYGAPFPCRNSASLWNTGWFLMGKRQQNGVKLEGQNLNITIQKPTIVAYGEVPFPVTYIIGSQLGKHRILLGEPESQPIEVETPFADMQLVQATEYRIDAFISGQSSAVALKTIEKRANDIMLQRFPLVPFKTSIVRQGNRGTRFNVDFQVQNTQQQLIIFGAFIYICAGTAFQFGPTITVETIPSDEELIPRSKKNLDLKTFQQNWSSWTDHTLMYKIEGDPWKGTDVDVNMYRLAWDSTL